MKTGARLTAVLLVTFGCSEFESPCGAAALADAQEVEEAANARWRHFVRAEQALYTPGRSWMDGSVGGSYQASGQKRVSVSSQWGYRFESSGPFVQVEASRILNFNSVEEGLGFANVGLGYESLWLLGRLKSSFSVGASILTSRTEVDTPGTWGYSLDVRPVSVRWGIAKGLVIWSAPMTFDLSIPVPNGIPLVLIHHQTLVGLEKTF